MKKVMYGKILALSLALIQVTALSGCAKESAVEESTDNSSIFEPISGAETDEAQDSSQHNTTTTEEQTEDVQEDASADETQTENGQEETSTDESQPEESTAKSRQDGERFEGTIMLEGTEESVNYEHAVSSTIGYEIDYEYESLIRKSDSDTERFISIYDDADNPENYLEIKYLPQDVDATVSSVSDELSKDYEILADTYVLDNGLNCKCVDTTSAKGSADNPNLLQSVYIIPAADGSLVCTAHYTIESAEGFGHRFYYMVNTLVVLPRKADESISAGNITEDQAISAIQNYCYSNNPELENIVNEGEYPAYWEVSTNDEGEIVVLFRSYTGAILRYYINPSTGDTYVTEFVEGITENEERMDESFNVKDYMN